MKILTLDHVAALSHASRDMESTITNNMEARHRRAIDDDIIRLADVRRWILKTIYEPGLPLQPDVPEKDETNGSKNNES